MAGSVEELQGIIAELSVRVTTLERALTLLLRERSERMPASAQAPNPVSAPPADPQPPRVFIDPAATPAPAPPGGISYFEATAARAPVTPIGESTYPPIIFDDEPPPPPKSATPVKIEVYAAIESFSRVAARLTEVWDQRDCDAYLGSLVIDDRGGRQGFPQPVIEELLFLAELRLVRAGLSAQEMRTWEHVRRR